jgi:hypothetical protein
MRLKYKPKSGAIPGALLMGKISKKLEKLYNKYPRGESFQEN